MDHWQKVLIAPHATILQAIEIIDRGAIGATFVVSDNNQLLGIVTDGDVRRAILKQVPMDARVDAVMNSQPRTAEQGASNEQLMSLMKQYSLQQIPIINEQRQIMNIAVLSELIKPTSRDNMVMLMVGGLGTRLGQLTKDCPKPLLKIQSKPVLEIILERFIACGFNKFVMAINYRGDMIRDYFKDGSAWDVDISYVEETKPLGTAGALGLLPEKPKSPFIVMNGDIMTQTNFHHLLEFHLQQHSLATICVREYSQMVPYGVVKINDNQLLALEEKPSQQFFVNAGIYVLDPKVLSYVKANEALDMTTLLEQLLTEKQSTSVFPLREYWTDIGMPEDFAKAHEDYQEIFAT